MCEPHGLERPGSKKKLHIHFKRHGTAIWKWFLNCLCKMAAAMLLCLVVVLFFQWKIALLRKRRGKKLPNWPGTKGCATVLIVTMVTRRISHFTTGIEGAHWGLSQTLSLLFFHPFLASVFKNKVASHSEVNPTPRRISTSFSRPSQEWAFNKDKINFRLLKKYLQQEQAV